MSAIATVECPDQLLIAMRMTPLEFQERVRWDAVISLYREGRLSSGKAAEWLGVPRVRFLMKAWEQGVELLDDSDEDFRRESSLIA
jgi:predicted HTH domain antitoxin